MPRIAPPLARAIDRLARRAHRFHRFAHHPLCREYKGELVRLGRRGRVCRGCACTVAGAAFGLIAGAAAPMNAPQMPALIALTAALAVVCAAFVAGAMLARARRADARPAAVRSADAGAAPRHVALPAVAASAARSGKLWTRALPAAVFAFCLGAGLRAGGAPGALSAVLAVAGPLLLRWAYRMRGPDRGPCLACPERAGVEVCRGYAPIVRRERALQRVAQAWITAAEARRRPA